MDPSAISPDLAQAVRRIKNLPTLPQVVTHLMQAVNNPNASASDVARIIANDQSLVSKILRIVNSAFYGLPKRVSTVTQATVILGFNTVKNLALSASVFDAFGNNGTGVGRWDRQKFWEHSIGCGVATKLLAREIRYSNPEEAFVSGLLHDVGKVVIDQFLHDQFLRILQTVEAEHCTITEAERQVIGVSHCDIGRWLAESWNLPVQLVECIGLHHDPQQAKHASRLVCLVHLADCLVRMEQVGYPGDDLVPDVNPVVWEVLRLSPEAIERLLASFYTEFERSSVFLQMASEIPQSGS
ncbi:MAG: HDOD domain-containing protein [candidate division KSB1 bacterium]|nr:HDOD domain-containing protein [candidate division KSB1 bacterium]